MRKMTDDQKKAYVAQQAAKRVKIQKDIKELTKKRATYVKAEMAKKGLDEKGSFDAALRKMVRTQAEKENFKFEK